MGENFKRTDVKVNNCEANQNHTEVQYTAIVRTAAATCSVEIFAAQSRYGAVKLPMSGHSVVHLTRNIA